MSMKFTPWEFYDNSLAIIWKWESTCDITGNLDIISNKLDEYFSELGYTFHSEAYTESGAISVINTSTDFECKQFNWFIDFQEFLEEIIIEKQQWKNMNHNSLQRELNLLIQSLFPKKTIDKICKIYKHEFFSILSLQPVWFWPKSKRWELLEEYTDQDLIKAKGYFHNSGWLFTLSDLYKFIKYSEWKIPLNLLYEKELTLLRGCVSCFWHKRIIDVLMLGEETLGELLMQTSDIGLINRWDDTWNDSQSANLKKVAQNLWNGSMYLRQLQARKNIDR